ncbi:MAG: transglutaminase domain-containing protein, partial [bacterium]|nr:transglutaminase domain-containing protein [bacterium]
VKDATDDRMGVIKGNDQFEFRYFAVLTALKSKAQMWIPIPATDNFQNVTIKKIKAPGKTREIKDKRHGNKVLYLELGPEDSKKNIEILYEVKRAEKSAYSSQGEDPSKHLNADKLVPIFDNFKVIAKKVTKNKKGDLVRARALYDHVIERMRYKKHGKGWGKGDAVYACDIGTGNCTDYHAYFISLARSVGIPARFAIGASIPSARNDGGVDGYHCWVEFHAEGKWWPLDISEADKYSALATYYFGHQPANRLELSRGRDLIVEPGPAWGPLNFLAYPV